MKATLRGSCALGASAVAMLAASIVVVIAATLMAGLASAEVPQKINYQGKIVDATLGTPLVGAHNVTFKLYDTATGGDTLWTESQVVSADSAGVMSCLLGASKPIAVSFDGPRWLEVEVNGETLLPRREMTSVPYAFLAERANHASGADSLGGNDADAFAAASHNHDDRYYTETELDAPGTINQAANPVDWTNLKNVPAGFADGTDNVGSGDGYSLDAADGDPTDVVYVNNVGDVGIGTSAPARKLHIVGEGPRVLIEGSVGNPEVNLKLTGDTSGQVWAIYKHSIAGDLRFFQGGDRVTIKNGTGAVGIGTAAPTENLDVAGSINLTGSLKIGGDEVLSVGSGGETRLGIGVGHSTGAGGNTFIGYESGLNTDTGNGNTFVGSGAGRGNTTAIANTFVGVAAGANNKTGFSNAFFGQMAGVATDGAGQNVFVGGQCGFRNTTGSLNTFIGDAAGHENTTGEYNTCLGAGAGWGNETGTWNTCLGAGAGHDSEGSRNVFVGVEAGTGETESDRLYIANGPDADDVLIYGEFSENRVGIGTTNPIHVLEIESRTLGDWITLHSGVANSIVGLGLRNDVRSWSMDVRGDMSDILAIRDNTAEATRLAIDSQGRIGVGTISPERLLHLKGDGPRVLVEASAGSPEVNFKTAGDATSEIWAIYKHGTAEDLRFYQNGDRVTFQSGSGDVGIGTTNPAGYKLYVNGEAFSTVSWSSSDARLKTDLLPIGDALSKVLQLRGLSFLWRTEEYPDRGLPGGRHYGLIAQDVEQVLPEVVKEGADGDKAVAYTELIPVLVESIKELKAGTDELRAEAEVLRAESQSLRADNDALRARLDALEKSAE